MISGSVLIIFFEKHFQIGPVVNVILGDGRKDRKKNFFYVLHVNWEYVKFYLNENEIEKTKRNKKAGNKPSYSIPIFLKR